MKATGANEMSSGRIEINETKAGRFKKIFGGVCLIGAFVFVFVMVDYVEMTQSSYLFIKIASALLLIILIPAYLYAMYKDGDGSPKIIIDSSGLNVQIGLSAPGFIPWNEIEEFKVKTIYSAPLIGIIMKNPESIYNSLNPITRMYHKLNDKIFEASWYLSVNMLDIELDEFVELVTEYHRKYG